MEQQQREGLTRLLAEVRPHGVAPGELGEYAELLLRHGPDAAERAFPGVAAHLRPGCRRCEADLARFTRLSEVWEPEVAPMFEAAAPELVVIGARAGMAAEGTVRARAGASPSLWRRGLLAGTLAASVAGLLLVSRLGAPAPGQPKPLVSSGYVPGPAQAYAAGYGDGGESAQPAASSDVSTIVPADISGVAARAAGVLATLPGPTSTPSGLATSEEGRAFAGRITVPAGVVETRIIILPPDEPEQAWRTAFNGLLQEWRSAHGSENVRPATGQWASEEVYGAVSRDGSSTSRAILLRHRNALVRIDLQGREDDVTEEAVAGLMRTLEARLHAATTGTQPGR